MAISAVYTTGATNGTTGTTFTLTPPNSTAAIGDVAVVVVAGRANTQFVTSVADTATGAKTFTSHRASGAASQTGVSIWYRKLASGDPGVGNVNTWTVTVTVASEGALMCYTGVDGTTPIDVQGTAGTAGSASATFNAATIATAGAMYIGALAESISVAALSSQTSGTPTLTSRANAGNGAGPSGSKAAVGVVDGTISGTGSTGAFVWSLTSSATWVTDSFALRPSTPIAPNPRNFFQMW